MAVEFKASPRGESITHATILRWLKPDGASVKPGEPVCEVETDKATEEEFAPAAGVLTIKVPAGTRVEIGKEVIGSVDPAGTPGAGVPAPQAPPAAVKNSTAAPAPMPGPAPTPPMAIPVGAVPAGDTRLSPAARVLVENRGIDPGQVPASARGVVTKSDVINYLETRPSAPGLAPAAGVSAPPAQTTAPSSPPVPQAAPPAPATGGTRETRQRMTPIRQRIAERLLAAQQNAAILTTFNEADLSAVIALRAKYKETFQKKHGVGLGFMSFFVKAAVEALKAYPSVNARIDGTDVVYQHFYDLGVAVSTERGLMVPVLRDCDKLSFSGVEKGIGELAGKARDGKIAVSDLQGGTFTITNGGIFGSMLSTPILNPPQSAILGMHAIQKRAVVIDDQIVIRPMMYLALSYDHRIIDGREAVSFLVRIKECLENPERLMLEV
jgi:2-oxoglutarate dehydrogenase E2 component (dihydrolipoamide succinyltransferase)